ncbi:MAG: peptidylprolyl isomerase [Burkholderiales bacterium]
MICTLHYRIALEDGTEVLSTFGGNPATLAVGEGELAPGFERCLVAAQPGVRQVFMLEPEDAFGPLRPELEVNHPLAGRRIHFEVEVLALT